MPQTLCRLLRRGITERATILTCPRLLIFLECIHCLFNLCAQIDTMKRSFMHLLPTALTIPPQPIQTALRPLLLQDHPHRILESHGIMRRIRRQEEHVPLVNMDIAELLVSRAADDHDGDRVVVHAIIVDWGFEHVGVFCDPVCEGQIQVSESCFSGAVLWGCPPAGGWVKWRCEVAAEVFTGACGEFCQNPLAACSIRRKAIAVIFVALHSFGRLV
ncbi:predicted protein [Plenodomus lingam JN3]|uniref:Predicted protein n=1 Tax=Leptosphaeria maculans (strain JN3 / isolate v23.1.3 / race Av1-4-5-6-7-8) TaxID=985895 RepID=E4ZXC2_LEPMJ|nr:predicted protein [Plenodomus lingam JN3]CBX95332.1 predicted protein [Plenodomus lingam JN3]